MTTIYAVSIGSYSDYSVQVLFADRSLAEQHAEAIGGEVEDMLLLSDAPHQFTVYSISNDTYHSRGEAYEWTYLAWSYNAALYKRAEVTEWGRGSVRVVGTDREAVRQSYRDRIARQAEAAARG